MSSIELAFSAQGKLAESIRGFKPRQPQTDMAIAVADAIEEKTSLVVEAGTGTGKTFAYLVPALMSKKKSIISTGTKNLQEQLFHRDLPVVKKSLGVNKQLALLKGRANYLCTHRLRQHSGNSTLLEAQTLSELSVVRKWANSTKSGDVGEIETLAEDAKVIPFVTSSVDNCLGKDCPDYTDCYLVKARRKAMEADVVVVNHHLFFADLALKDTGFGELIPEVDVVVFDEAHQLPDIASEYFGDALSTRQVQDTCKELETLYRTQLKDIQQVSLMADKLRVSAADLRMLFGQYPEKGNWAVKLSDTEIQRHIKRLGENLAALYEVLKLHLGREDDLDKLFERVTQMRTKLEKLTDTTQTGVSLWYETTLRHLVIRLTPLQIADKFREIITTPKRSWIFTSATLVVGTDFSHYQQQMGLEGANTLMLDSPFDYQQQSMLCIPRYLPDPNASQMREFLVSTAIKLIQASRGRCFLLFTSYATLNDMAKKLEDKVNNKLLVQGSMSKRALLDTFLEDKKAVLLATGAFWEGVDIRGDDLTCVLIDKLPFASPDDPLLQARIEDCRKQGGNPFAQLQIPQAVISLKQGAGRLIRDETDKGVLVICDHRLVSREYGRTFVESLPPMRRTRDLSIATDYLETLHDE
jgi:ATP-dependent DNA helicase DinG